MINLEFNVAIVFLMIDNYQGAINIYPETNN